ncbi:MAG: hypothetical protein ACRDS0_16840 [Pseudonocardiaceae bacterium]
MTLGHLRDGGIESVTCEVFDIPTDAPEADGTLAWSSTTMVLVTVRAGGSEGLGWTYAGAGCQAVVDHQLTGVLHGGDPMDIPGLWEGMVRACRNLGRPGLVSCAISAVDIRCGISRRGCSALPCPPWSVAAATPCRSMAAAASPPTTTPPPGPS